MGYYVKYKELQAAQSLIIKQINQWYQELEHIKQQVQAIVQMQEMKGETANSIKNYMQDIHLPVILSMQNLLKEYMSKMLLYCNEYYKLDTKQNALMLQDRLDDQITVIQTRTGVFQEIEGKVAEGVGIASGLASVTMPSGDKITSSYDKLSQNTAKLMNEIGECEYGHLRTDFRNIDDVLSELQEFIHIHSQKGTVTITSYQAGSIAKIPAFQKLKEASANQRVELEEVKKESLNYKEINAVYWNRTDHYFDKGWMNQKIKLEGALNIIRLETVEHGSLDILSLIKQYGHGSENYRLMALIKLAQLSQGTYSTKENITKVEDEEDGTQKVLTGLKEAKDNVGEFLETTGKFLLSQLPESFNDIIMFCGGFSDRVLTNVFPGSNFMNEPYQETLLIPYTKGAIAGDIVSMVTGVLMTIVGGSMAVTGGLGVVAGTAAVATGIGAVPGVAIDGASVGLIIEGVAVAGVGVELTLSASKNIGNDLQKLQEAKNSVNSEIEGGSTSIPDKAKDIANQVKANNGAAPQGYKGGRTYKNIPLEDGAQKLPEGVNYKEYDVNPYIKGQNRGTERIVIGDDGSVWYTNDHYYTFTQIE